MRFSEPLKTQRGLMTFFFNAGLVYASWGVEVPFVKNSFSLSAAALSLTLLALAIGAICAMTRVSRWLLRWSTHDACTGAGIAVALLTGCLLLLPNFPVFVVALFFFGALNASLDVAINAEASALETAGGKAIMSRLHAMFSLGGIVGAAAGGGALAWGATPVQHMILAAAVSAALTLWGRRGLSRRPLSAEDCTSQGELPARECSPDSAQSHTDRAQTRATSATSATSPTLAAGKPGAARPEGSHRVRRTSALLWTLGGVSCLALIAEGAMYDWSAVYFQDVLATSHAAASSGYAAFSGGMTLGRFSGDAVRSRAGSAALLAVSGVLAAIGLSVAVTFRIPSLSILGLLAMGLGLANMIPVLFAAAGALPGQPPARAIATVAACGYAGMMVGPVLIGFATQALSLTAALYGVAVACLVLGMTSFVTLRVPASSA